MSKTFVHIAQQSFANFAVLTHRAMKEKGFWDTKRGVWETMFLVDSEMAEAGEAVRNRRTLSAKGLQEWAENIDALWSSDSDFDRLEAQDSFKKIVKDTTGDELADVMIRIADYLGFLFTDEYQGQSREKYFDEWLDRTRKESHHVFPKEPGLLCSYHLMYFKQMCVDITQSYPQRNSVDNLISMIVLTERIAEYYGVDLYLHIALKERYNLSRAYKHGKTC